MHTGMDYVVDAVLSMVDVDSRLRAVLSAQKAHAHAISAAISASIKRTCACAPACHHARMRPHIFSIQSLCIAAFC